MSGTIFCIGGKMSRVTCRICGLIPRNCTSKNEPQSNLSLPDIGCMQCNSENRACPGFSLGKG